MSEHNKALVRRFYEEVENGGQLDVVDELIHPEFRDVHNSVAPFPVEGIDGVKELVTALRGAAGLHIHVEDIVAEGDTVVVRFTSDVTHQRDFYGVAPTGRKFKGYGVEIFRVRDGKLAERWVFIDQLPMMRELGVVPRPVQH